MRWRRDNPPDQARVSLSTRTARLYSMQMAILRIVKDLLDNVRPNALVDTGNGSVPAESLAL